MDRFGQTSSDSTAPTQWAFPFLCPYLLGFHFGGAHQTLAVHTHTELGSPPGCQELGKSQELSPKGTSTREQHTTIDHKAASQGFPGYSSSFGSLLSCTCGSL